MQAFLVLAIANAVTIV